MMIPEQVRSKRRNDLTAFLSLLVAIVLLVPISALAQDPLPAQVKDIKMGVPMSSVIPMIEKVGTHKVKPLPYPGRKALVWNLPLNPYYTKILFGFTKKDRLFLIRLILKNLSSSDVRSLKKALFEKYGISWDTPWSMKIRDNDAVMYGPPKQGPVYFFELTNPKTGQKALELFDVPISKADRKKKVSKKSKQEGAQAPKTESTPPKSKPPLQEQKQGTEK